MFHDAGTGGNKLNQEQDEEGEPQVAAGEGEGVAEGLLRGCESVEELMVVMCHVSCVWSQMFAVRGPVLLTKSQCFERT